MRHHRDVGIDINDMRGNPSVPWRWLASAVLVVSGVVVALALADGSGATQAMPSSIAVSGHSDESAAPPKGLAPAATPGVATTQIEGSGPEEVPAAPRAVVTQVGGVVATTIPASPPTTTDDGAGEATTTTTRPEDGQGEQTTTSDHRDD